MLILWERRSRQLSTSPLANQAPDVGQVHFSFFPSKMRSILLLLCEHHAKSGFCFLWPSHLPCINLVPPHSDFVTIPQKMLWFQKKKMLWFLMPQYMQHSKWLRHVFLLFSQLLTNFRKWAWRPLLLSLLQSLVNTYMKTAHWAKVTVLT